VIGGEVVVNPFEETLREEMSWLLRAGMPVRAIRVTVRDRLVVHLARGPLGAREVTDAMEATVRAACRVVREADAPEDLVDIVCLAALDVVRGHGGETARWLTAAAATADAVLDELTGGQVGLSSSTRRARRAG
jgi:hypothetical protein